MNSKTDPFAQRSTFVNQAALVLAPLATSFGLMLWNSGDFTFSVALAIGAGIVVGTLIALARDRQARQARNWVNGLAESPRTEGAKPRMIWDPTAQAFVRPIQRLARQATQFSDRVHELESMIGTMIDVIPDPVLLIGEEQTVEYFNPSARAALDLSETGLPLVGLSRDPALVGAVQGALNSLTPSSLSIQFGFDPVQEFEARVEPVIFRPGRHGVLIALRERTEQLMIERMRSDFVADASHEMRTPMTTIIGAVETLRGPARDDPDVWDIFLQDMEQAGQRMMRLLDDLLSLSRIELEASRSPHDVVSISDIARAVAKDLEAGAERRDIMIDFKVETGDHGLKVSGDPGQLRQVIANLVENAIKYSHSSTTVTIELARVEAGPSRAGPLTGRQCVRLSVRDQGDGIEPEHIPRLTERFYRVDKARSRDLGGTGLGLAIVKHILRRHHGHLDIQSEVGRGSVFTIYLPCGDKQTSHHT